MKTRQSILRLNSPIQGAMITAPRTKEKNEAIKNSFGWIGPDYRQSQVNPNGPSDAVPSAEDYFGFPFRFITNTIVGAGSWKATEFPSAVLKDALPLFNHKPFYVNHETEISNNIGISSEPKFTAQKKQKDGVVPAGVDGLLVIDSKLHTDLCRKLNGLPVPHIQSVSIGVIYEWKPSHDFTDSEGNDDDYEFERQIGRTVDGKLVRRIATKILDIIEISLVDLGADPFAKIRNESGELINIERSAVVGSQQFEKDKYSDRYKSNGEMYLIENSFNKENRVLLEQEVLQKSNVKTKEQIQTSKKDHKMEKILEAFALKLGKDVEDITVEDVNNLAFTKNDKMTQLKADAKAFNDNKEKIEKFDALKTQVDDLEKVVKVFNVENKEDFKFGEDEAKKVLDLSNHGNDIHQANMSEAERLYRLKAGDDCDDAIIDTIKAASPKQAIAFVKEYGGKAAQEFGLQIVEGKIQYRVSQEAGEGSKGDESNIEDEFDFSSTSRS